MARVTLYEGKFKKFVCVDGWEFVEGVNCSGIVVILAVTDDQKVILVEQYRIPVGNKVIEFPAGLANDFAVSHEESLSEAARRELLEETGYQTDELTLVFEGPVSSASSSDILSFFRARGLKKVAKGGGDHTESIVVHEVPLSAIDSWLSDQKKRGLIIDPRVYAGLYFLTKTQ